MKPFLCRACQHRFYALDRRKGSHQNSAHSRPTLLTSILAFNPMMKVSFRTNRPVRIPAPTPKPRPQVQAIDQVSRAAKGGYTGAERRKVIQFAFPPSSTKLSGT
jgi:hypothetical protein